MLSADGLDHAWIERHIPHKGCMCLLDRVASWNGEQIRCLAVSHRDAHNPLRHEGRLAAVYGIEYAAQAMAVHGALLAPPNKIPRAGYLVSVRGVRLHVARLDDISAELDIAASCVTRDDNHLIYEFFLTANHCNLLEGRAAVLLDATRLGAGAQGQT